MLTVEMIGLKVVARACQDSRGTDGCSFTCPTGTLIPDDVTKKDVLIPNVPLLE